MSTAGLVSGFLDRARNRAEAQPGQICQIQKLATEAIDHRQNLELCMCEHILIIFAKLSQSNIRLKINEQISSWSTVYLQNYDCPNQAQIFRSSEMFVLLETFMVGIKQEFFFKLGHTITIVLDQYINESEISRINVGHHL